MDGARLISSCQSVSGGSHKQAFGGTPERREDGESVREAVKEYYGKVLKSSDDLKTNVCLLKPKKMSPRLREAHSHVHPVVLSKYFGCGSVFPDEMEGKRVLDLGCGAGKDVYVLAQLVGEGGCVVGVDMTEEVLETAREHEEWHKARFGYAKKNTEFVKGQLEALDSIESLAEGSFDVIVSNCVVNLTADKGAVLKGIFRLLKEGGEFYFSDMYADRRIPMCLQKDTMLWGEGLGGASYWGDFLRFTRQAGFVSPRLVSSDRISIRNPEVAARVGHIQYFSAVYRLFKAAPGSLESSEEDYGQAVVYKGGVEGAAEEFSFDAQNSFVKGRVVLVSGNTWTLLRTSRFARHFKFIGDFSTHLGLFDPKKPGETVTPFTVAV
uniref:Arsenite methyltransferase n=1 Tax=Chromera velia CCMP2878 TaxID=1169474 RepID=A0A0G4HUJ1_9ALVE|mmetsp:Transcript_44015/g.86890  ORF Transcript_44015/g.86890 Transcript_44015/m.86890 type:complete len:381 (-) Transcript_44015:105-1247(-)|eukprot:Cvel_8618.t1-p1 / transcript=Cvel_8618.t1 / gene=Cvel_8618 / organism=Chromera_velia_CCMP2878 / gene_product=Arsenite methyltransferase, putative / transcript_product=Arsenite methyltransferase, putative / location=Cvel_scaffold480:450-1589(+) / protein_length=380 / sequence_SO=supercontig / SO=protein_coding / is_pseudo=false